MSKYILFCAQEANFQTRSMLIPYDAYLENKNLQKKLDILRRNSFARNFSLDGQDYHVPQLIVQNITWSGNSGISDRTEYSSIVDELTGIANGYDGNYDWTSKCIFHLGGGFNNVKNYCKFSKMKSFKGFPIEIVEGFLVLETDNGKFRHPKYN